MCWPGQLACTTGVVRRNTGLITFVLVNKDGVAGFPGLWCVACGLHDDKEHVDGVLELSRQHFQEFIDYAVWAWRLIACEGPDTFCKGALVKDGIVKPVSCLFPLCFVLSNLRFKSKGVRPPESGRGPLNVGGGCSHG